MHDNVHQHNHDVDVNQLNDIDQHDDNHKQYVNDNQQHEHLDNFNQHDVINIIHDNNRMQSHLFL